MVYIKILHYYKHIHGKENRRRKKAKNKWIYKVQYYKIEKKRKQTNKQTLKEWMASLNYKRTKTMSW